MLVLLNQIISGSNLLSGGEKITVELLRRWEKLLKIKVVIPQHALYLVKENLDVEFIDHRVTFLDKNYIFRKFIFFIPLIWMSYALRSCIKISEMQIYDNMLFSSGDFFCNTIPAFFKKNKDKEITWIALIFHIIDPPFRRKGSSNFIINLASYFFQKASLFLIRKRADKVLLLNEIVKEQLKKQGFEEGKLFVIGSGIDFKEVDSSARGDIAYDACFMARISPTKGIFDLPRIWDGVARKKDDSRLVVMGGGFKKDVIRLRKLIHEFSLERQIDLAGVKVGKEKYSLIKSSKVFIFPSYEEGFAISILEAMACRVPVVAWDLPVYRSIYKDKIITIPVGNIEMFISALINLLEDDKLRNSLAEEGYNFSRQYDWDIVAKKAYERINS